MVFGRNPLRIQYLPGQKLEAFEYFFRAFFLPYFPCCFCVFRTICFFGGGVLSPIQSRRDQGPGLLSILGDRWWLLPRDKFTGLARKPSLALPGEEDKTYKKLSH